MHKRVLKHLAVLAEDIPEFAGQRVIACVLEKGSIVSYGFGHEKTHPFQAKYGRNADSIYWHAETNAIHNAQKKGTDLSKTSLYVLRRKTNSEMKELYGLAKPCDGCARCIEDHRIPRVIYSMEGEISSKVWHYGVIEC